MDGILQRAMDGGAIICVKKGSACFVLVLFLSILVNIFTLTNVL